MCRVSKPVCIAGGERSDDGGDLMLRVVEKRFKKISGRVGSVRFHHFVEILRIQFQGHGIVTVRRMRMPDSRCVRYL